MSTQFQLQLILSSTQSQLNLISNQLNPLQTVAAYLRVHLGMLDKLQRKAVTHCCEVEWWRTLMVECVTVFDCLILHQISQP